MGFHPRSNTILQLIVEAYIHNAQPVSSHAVARRHPELGLSTATIRNVMAELEAGGLLQQPHTSAGRVPTERGMRTYLDTLVRPKLRPRDRSRLEAVGQGDAAQFPAQLGQALSALSGQLAVVTLPRVLGSRLREVGLVRCAVGRFLAYFVSPGGLVQQKLVEVDFDLDAAALAQVQNYLNARLANCTLGEIRTRLEADLDDATRSCDDLQRRAVAIGTRLLPDVPLEVVVEGTAHLLDQPEFSDLGRLRAMLRTIEEKETLLRLLDGILGQSECGDVRVMLGSEHRLPAVADLACVGCAWQGKTSRTAIGLLGPSRMDYGRLVPLVQYATELFGRFWDPV